MARYFRWTVVIVSSVLLHWALSQLYAANRLIMNNFFTFAIALAVLPLAQFASILLALFSKRESLRLSFMRFVIPVLLIVSTLRLLNAIFLFSFCQRIAEEDPLCLTLTLHACFNIPFILIGTLTLAVHARSMDRKK
ncbi:MAG: hypothetical protein OXN19_16010 [Caldilineaceae bacterium]|nr:hypothetical protein [Caldilineaceae bacterium]